MGSHLSKIKERNGVNYDCPVCKNSNKLPNLVGKFVLINDFQFKCSGCNNIFDKAAIHSFYKNKESIRLDHVIKV